jgi:hypothetical protein
LKGLAQGCPKNVTTKNSLLIHTFVDYRTVHNRGQQVIKSPKSLHPDLETKVGAHKPLHYCEATVQSTGQRCHAKVKAGMVEGVVACKRHFDDALEDHERQLRSQARNLMKRWQFESVDAIIRDLRGRGMRVYRHNDSQLHWLSSGDQLVTLEAFRIMEVMEEIEVDRHNWREERKALNHRIAELEVKLLAYQSAGDNSQREGLVDLSA